jgi:hypothetical protein
MGCMAILTDKLAQEGRTNQLAEPSIYGESGNAIKPAISEAIPWSLFRHGALGWAIKVLPVDLDLKAQLAMILLKLRTLSPVAQVFIECARCWRQRVRLPILSETKAPSGPAPQQTSPARRASRGTAWR